MAGSMYSMGGESSGGVLSPGASSNAGMEFARLQMELASADEWDIIAGRLDSRQEEIGKKARLPF